MQGDYTSNKNLCQFGLKVFTISGSRQILAPSRLYFTTGRHSCVNPYAVESVFGVNAVRTTSISNSSPRKEVNPMYIFQELSDMVGQPVHYIFYRCGGTEEEWEMFNETGYVPNRLYRQARVWRNAMEEARGQG